MKSLIPPATALAVLFGVNALLPNPSETSTPYAFDPLDIRRNICGPIGTKRSSFFRPEVARLLSSAAHASTPPSNDVPLLPGLDSLSFPISSTNAEAQAYFQQGFAFIYGFNHWEAIRAFKKAQELDPECAICFWGEAMALGPNINAPMDQKSGEQALVAIRKAQALIDHANKREKALIKAGAVRYSDAADVSRNDLDQRYADALAELVAKFPKDQDIATMYAEALMTTAPWDYWERDFTTPKPHIRTAIDTIEKTLSENPNHYGSIHLYIHLYEASQMAEKAAKHADKLAGLAPGSGHLVHMPGHIYFRIGRYIDSLKTNIDAVAVDEAYLRATSGSDLYRYGYYPHNVHFVLVSAQMAGDGATALEYANKLDQLIPLEVLKGAEWIAPIKAAPYFAHAQFGDVDEVLALPSPGDAVPYLKAMWHYARGVALAEAGGAGAEAEAQAITALVSTDGVQNAGIPAETILTIAGNIITAKYMMSQNEPEEAIELLRASVTLQNSMSYTEPPYWYYALEQTLGAAYFKAGDFEGAETAFEASLIRHPNSAWSLYGLWQSQIQLGKKEAAKISKALYKQASLSKGTMDILKL